LLVTGIKMMVQKDVQVDPSKNPVVRFARKFLPVTEESANGRFLSE